MVALFRASAVAFTTTKDQQWSVADCKLSSRIRRPLPFQGKLYMLDERKLSDGSNVTQIFQVEPPRHHVKGSASSSVPPPKSLIATCPASGTNIPFYLTECDSEILLIGLGNPLYSRNTLYRLADLTLLGRLVPVTSIGDNILLVSDKVLSVSSRVLPNVEGNSVVMVNGGNVEAYFGQYQLSSSTWSPAADGSIRDHVPSPCSLIYHIFTCCRPDHWDKGEISFQVRGNLTWKVKGRWRYGVKAHLLTCSTLILLLRMHSWLFILLMMINHSALACLVN